MQGADRCAELNGVRLRYRDEGQGPALLLIHGWTLDLDIWNAQAQSLRASCRVVRHDRRGFGLSTGIPAISADVHDAASLLQQLGLARVTVVGMSQGVRVALRLALTRPELVARLVLDGAPPGCHCDRASGDGDLSMDAFSALARQSGMPAFRRVWAAHEFMQLQSQDPATALLLEAVLARYPGRDLLEVRAVETLQPVDLAGISQPALVLNGESDSVQRRDFGRALAHDLPAARYALVPHAGHLANLDNPTAYNRLLREFCGACPHPVS
jgi:pimeloyl-ACP methyl ester carboxylesterase